MATYVISRCACTVLTQNVALILLWWTSVSTDVYIFRSATPRFVSTRLRSSVSKNKPLIPASGIKMMLCDLTILDSVFIYISSNQMSLK